MLIVLEGCDGTGKSTLAGFLAQLLNAEVIHCTSRTPNDFNFFWSIVEASKERNIIADRFCYGQFVYQEPRERRLSEANLRTLELSMLHAGAKVVLVTAPSETVEARLAARGEITSVPVCELLCRFKSVMAESLLPVAVYDTTKGGSL